MSMRILSIHISIMGYWRLGFGTDKRLEVAQQVPGKDDKLQYTLKGLGRHGRELRILYPRTAPLGGSGSRFSSG